MTNPRHICQNSAHDHRLYSEYTRLAQTTICSDMLSSHVTAPYFWQAATSPFSVPAFLLARKSNKLAGIMPGNDMRMPNMRVRTNFLDFMLLHILPSLYCGQN